MKERLKRIMSLGGYLKRLDYYIIAKFLGTYFFAIVLIISIAVWYIMLEKAGNLISAMKKSQAFLRAFREKRNPFRERFFAARRSRAAKMIVHHSPLRRRTLRGLNS